MDSPEMHWRKPAQLFIAYNPVAPNGHVWQEEVAIVGKPVAGCTGFLDGAFVLGRSRQLPFWQQVPQYASEVPQYPHWLQHIPSAQGLLIPHVAVADTQLEFGIVEEVIVLVVVTVAPVFIEVDVTVQVVLVCW